MTDTTGLERRASETSVRVAGLVAALLLALGLLLPYLTYERDGGLVTTSLLTFGTGGLTFTGTDGRHDAVSVVLGIAFLGLALVAVVAVVALVALLAGRAPRPRAGRVARAAAGLLLLGLLGAWAMVLVAFAGTRGGAEVAVHAGLPVFSVGALLNARVVARTGRLSRR